jgi:uncharacterized surface protein with fasciclin (FAS1) repeats
MRDIFQTVRATGIFETLLSAFEAVNLSETLSGPGPITLFAPADEAFKKLPVTDLAGLLPNKRKLRHLLTSHVMADRVTLSDIKDMGVAKMMNDKIFNIIVRNDEIKVDGAKIIQGDILCSNGVIHVIDALISHKQWKKGKIQVTNNLHKQFK